MVLAVAVKQALGVLAVIIIVATVSAVTANNVTIPVRGTVVIAELGVSVLMGKPAVVAVPAATLIRPAVMASAVTKSGLKILKTQLLDIVMVAIVVKVLYAGGRLLKWKVMNIVNGRNPVMVNIVNVLMNGK
jgi:hypothetical protein